MSVSELRALVMVWETRLHPPPLSAAAPSHYWVETSEVWALLGFSSCNFGQNYEIWERCNILAKSKFTNICKIWNCRWVLPFVKLPKYFQSLHLSNVAKNLKHSSFIRFKILPAENSFSLTFAKRWRFHWGEEFCDTFRSCLATISLFSPIIWIWWISIWTGLAVGRSVNFVKTQFGEWMDWWSCEHPFSRWNCKY